MTAHPTVISRRPTQAPSGLPGMPLRARGVRCCCLLEGPAPAQAGCTASARPIGILMVSTVCGMPIASVSYDSVRVPTELSSGCRGSITPEPLEI